MRLPPGLSRYSILTALCLTTSIGVSTAESPPTILVISGNITASEVQLDRAALEAMMSATITTSTPWFDGISTFEGVPLADLLGLVGAQGTTITAIALNDYMTDIPISDVEDFGPILALKRDGAFMGIRDKGPLFVIYPYDSDPALQKQLYYSRSAWQVAKLVIK